MPIAPDPLCDAAEPSSSRNFGRLSLIFQRASSPKLKSDKLRRPTTAPSKKSHKRGLNTGSTSVLSETHHSYAAASSLSVTDTYSLSFSSPIQRINTCQSELPPSLPPSPTSFQDPTSTPDAMNLLKKARKLSRVFGDFPTSMTTDRHPIPDILVFDQSNSPTKTEISSSTTLNSSFASSESSITNKGALRRSFTVGHAIESHVGNTDVHRSKSHSALRPSLAIPSASVSSGTPPISPIEFASRRSGDIGQSQDASRDDAAPETIVNSQADHGMPLPNARLSEYTNPGTDILPLSERRSSIPSSPSLSVGFISSAKTSPTLKDEAPLASAQFVVVPHQPPLSPTSVPLPPSPSRTSLEQTPRRSSSMRGKMSEKVSEPRKRLSLDILSLKTSVGPPALSPNDPPRPASSPEPTEGGSNKRSLKKTRSLWMRKARVEPEPELLPRPSVDASIPSFSPMRESFDTSAPVGPLTEKQRLLNVRRAKKMTRLFGDQPPMALFQIAQLATASTSNLTADEVDGAEADDLEERRRDSLATIISISSSISTNLSNSHNLRLRDSYLSISSVVTNSSPSTDAVVTTGSVVVVPGSDIAPSQISEQPLESLDPIHHKRYETLSNNSTLAPINFTQHRRSPSPRPYTAPSATMQPPTPTTRIYHPPPSPRTPPPFSDLFDPPSPADDWVELNDSPPDASRVSLDIESSLSPADFHARQRRAAKLSQFFGVGLNDLADVLPANSSAPKRNKNDVAGNHNRLPSTAIMPAPPIPTSPMKPSPSPADTFGMHPMVTTRVEVAAAKSSRLRFLGHGGDVREMDMSDAIEKLRRMRSV